MAMLDALRLISDAVRELAWNPVGQRADAQHDVPPPYVVVSARRPIDAPLMVERMEVLGIDSHAVKALMPNDYRHMAHL